jgi:diguanylate cyclase (GGDEF)-like protein
VISGPTYIAKNIRNKLALTLNNYRWPAALAVGGVLLGLAGWFLVFSGLEHEKARIEREAFRKAEGLAISYASRVSQGFGAIDQLSLVIRYIWLQSNGKFLLENANSAFLPYPAFRLTIVDKRGQAVSSTHKYSENLYLGDSEEFLTQKKTLEDKLYIGKLRTLRGTDRIAIPFTRKLLDRNNDFAGIITVNVDPRYFTFAYNGVVLGRHGLLGVIRNDSTVLAARIDDNLQNDDTKLISLPSYSGTASSRLIEGERAFFDKRNRYVAWNPVPLFPAAVIMGIDQQDELAPYYAHRAATLRQAAITSVVLALLTLLAMILSARLAGRKKQLLALQKTYRLATESGHDGFYIARPIRNNQAKIVDFRIVDCNERGAALFGKTRELIVGRGIAALYGTADPGKTLALLSQAMEHGSSESELEVPAASPLTAQWAHVKIMREGDNLAITLRDTSEIRAHVAQLEKNSNEDALTSLPNRRWVEATLPQLIDQAAEKQGMLGVLYIDLDRFKDVNDTAGHAGGDSVLQAAARRLSDAIRPYDAVARFGGDEFVVILTRLSSEAYAAQVAERIVHAFQQNFRISHTSHQLGASIGISLYPSDGKDAKTLLNCADIAMYSAKTAGKSNFRFYDDQFYRALRTRLETEFELQQAIRQGQLVMYYQPRIELATGETASMEALVRWQHPVRGMVSPLEFIPLAEETGLIIELGAWVIDTVCDQLAQWAGQGDRVVPVSVNVSSRQFNETDVAAILADALAKHHVDPTLLEVELTETSMTQQTAHVGAGLRAIQGMGIKLLIDDFGTGYSSLSQLRRLDFDVLKVDQSFTAELGKTEDGVVFFKAIITMAHALGLRVVAEGVETRGQAGILNQLGCDEIQGYLVSRPVPASSRQPVLQRWAIPAMA